MIKNLLDVFRPLRWYRNLFMLAGSFLAIKILNINFIDLSSGDLFKVLVTFLSTCLVASGNYGINEVLDAKSDSFHPEKKNRAIPSGKISPNLVIVISVFLYISGFFFVSKLNNLPLFLSIFLLFISGIFYNVKPIRLKDLPYLDFLSEAANNPIRLLIGWYAIAKPHQLVPSSFILSFWFLGVFLMAAKRFGEIRLIKDKKRSASYRNSLKYYSETRVLFSMIAALVAFSFMFGALAMKYSIDLVLVLPFIIIWTIWFFYLAYQNNTIVKDPERIFEKKGYLTFSMISLLLFLYLFYTGNQILGWIK